MLFRHRENKLLNDEAETLLTHQQLMEQYSEAFEKLADKAGFELSMDKAQDKNKALYKRSADFGEN